MNDAVKKAATEVPIPPAPLDPTVRADNVAKAFAASSGSLGREDQEKLRGLVLEALDERFQEVQDHQLGRVLGSAIFAL